MRLEPGGAIGLKRLISPGGMRSALPAPPSFPNPVPRVRLAGGEPGAKYKYSPI